MNEAGQALSETQWRGLAREIRKGRCVLVLGPGAVTIQRGDDHVEVLDELADYLADRLNSEKGEELPGAAASPTGSCVDHPRMSILEVAQAVRGKAGRSAVKDWVHFFYRDCRLDHEQQNKDLIALVGVGFWNIINTVPGAPIEQAVRKAGRIPLVGHYDYLGPEPDALDQGPGAMKGSEQHPLVYHLFGSAEDGALDSLVVSQTALLDFLVHAVSDEPQLPEDLRDHLRKEDTTALFVGFQLHQWHLLTLMHALFLRAKNRDDPSFVIEQGRSTGDDIPGDFYWKANKIEFLDVPLTTFVEELVKNVGAPAGPDRPVVFISYASEDVEEAEWLAGKLDEYGVQPWWDKRTLREGEAWDDKIRAALRKANYCAVLQSKQLQKKDFNYVNKEINDALDRQREVRKTSERFFIVPVLIDGPEHRLEEFEDLQDADVSGRDAEEVRRLAARIKDDFEKVRLRAEAAP